MLEKLSKCPVCNHSGLKIFLESEDYFFTKEPFSIFQCLACGIKFTNPRPDREWVQKYYQSEQYISHDAKQKGIIPLLYKAARKFTLKAKFEIVRQYSSGAFLLDIGCGTGEFLHYCKKKGYTCFGIEPNEKAREYSRHNYLLQVTEDLFASDLILPGFDCITLWHVLEHIYELNETLDKIRNLMNVKGCLILALPNSRSYDANYYQKHWAAYDLPRHLYHFDNESVAYLAEKHHLKIEQILPQKLDSFYISLLSERYKTGTANFIPAFYAGLMSNLKGRNPETGYSTQLYILRDKNS